MCLTEGPPSAGCPRPIAPRRGPKARLGDGCGRPVPEASCAEAAGREGDEAWHAISFHHRALRRRHARCRIARHGRNQAGARRLPGRHDRCMRELPQPGRRERHAERPRAVGRPGAPVPGLRSLCAQHHVGPQDRHRRLERGGDRDGPAGREDAGRAPAQAADANLALRRHVGRRCPRHRGLPEDASADRARNAGRDLPGPDAGELRAAGRFGPGASRTTMPSPMAPISASSAIAWSAIRRSERAGGGTPG